MKCAHKNCDETPPKLATTILDQMTLNEKWRCDSSSPFGKNNTAEASAELIPLVHSKPEKKKIKKTRSSSFIEYIKKSPLLGRRRNRRHALLFREAHVSLETLNPHHECRSRRSNTIVAVFNLVATVCGGGVLSLPLAFSKAGIIPTFVLMIFGATITDFSLFCLVDASRKTGARTYGDVAFASFGSAAQVVTTTTLFIMLCGSLIAYQVLVRDIWSPVIFNLIPHSENFAATVGKRQADNIILGGILTVGLPLLLKKDLHALRHTCYVGFTSCVLLMIAIVYRALEKVVEPNTTSVAIQIKWYTTNPQDILFAFPIVVLCFFCSYNVLSVHSQLVNPTRGRIRAVLSWSMLICFSLFVAVGLCGYVYAGEATNDNILLNFEFSDKAILAGRMGFCLTLMFGLPLILLPCREAFVSIPKQVNAWLYDMKEIEKFEHLSDELAHGRHLVINGVDFDEEGPFGASLEEGKKQEMRSLNRAFHSFGASVTRDYHSIGNLANASNDSTDDTQNSSNEDLSKEDGTIDTKVTDRGHESEARQRALAHVGSTIFILICTYSVAASVPGVALVWSIFGSSMAIWIAFIVPSGCYLKIREEKGLTYEATAVWLMLFTMIWAMVVCTRQAVANAFGS